ncbi:MAG: SIMPL domain-containing protein [Burkholderiales bacterium]|nr:SIMPL domain-containing protein [Burkholderiales bacterium]
MPLIRPAACLAVLACLATPALHAADAPRDNLVNLSSSATLEVPRDQMTVVLSVTREGAEAASVQAALKQVLDQALAEARRSASPGALEVQTGGFSMGPRYNRDGRINGWQGSAELILEGTDTARVAQLAGRLSQMNVASVNYGLSRPLREKHEADVTREAIQRFRARAADVAKAFGFSGYTLGEVSVRSGESGPSPLPRMAMTMAKAADAESAPLPVEAGKGSITVTVSGNVLLTR